MTNETKSPAQAAPVVAASELSDEQIDEAIRAYVAAGKRQHGIREAMRCAIEAAAVLAAATPAASSETQQYRTGYGEGVRAAAKLCDAKYEARVASGHPREASTARALAEEIRNLQSIAPSPAVQQPAEGGWISVDERMPAEWEMVLTCGSKKVDQAVMAWNARDGWQIETANEWHSAYAPTHWRELPPLPAAPTQAEGE